MIFFDYNTPRRLQESYEDKQRPLNSPSVRTIELMTSHKHIKELEMAKKQSKFMQPMKLSEDLKAVVGHGPLPRTEVTKKLWAYIKTKQLPRSKKQAQHRC